jgi:hypothetical protein
MLTKQTVSKLQKFGAREKQIVLQLLVHSGAKYTKNSSGYMFNVKDISPELLSRVNETVTAISKDKADIDDTELKREALLKEYARLNELGARESLLKERQLFLDSITDTRGDGSNITFSMERVVKYTKSPVTLPTSGNLVSNVRLPKTGLWSRILKKRFNHSQRMIDVDSVETTQAVEEGPDEFYNEGPDEGLMIDTDGDGGECTIDDDNDKIDSYIPELPELKIKSAEDEAEDEDESESEDDEVEDEDVIRDTPFMNDVIKELEELGYIFKAGGLLVFEDYIHPTVNASISVT